MINEIIRYLKYILYIPFALVTFFVIRIISNLHLIKFNFIPSERIGHMAMEIELYLSQKKKSSFHLLAPHKIIANNFLLKLIKKKLILLPPEFMFLLIKLNHLIGNNKHLLVLTPESASGDRDMSNILDKTKPNLNFNKEEIQKGESFLSQINTSLYNYICIHVRDENYLRKTFPDDVNLNRHSHRNCDISNYTDTINFLLDQNFTVIRMGQNKIKKLDIQNNKFIDYANSSYVSEFLDIFLPAHCKFFISSCSGLDFVAKIFRRPILFTNQVPIGTSVLSSSKDMVIFKKYFSTEKNRYLSISEIFEKNIELIKNRDEFNKLKINVIENTNLEILESTKDMIKYLKNELEENKLEVMFKEILTKQMNKKGTYNFWHNRLISRIGPSYLKINNQIYFY